MSLDAGTRAQLQHLMDDAFENRSSRRTLMQRTLAIGGAAGLAYVFPRAVAGQGATPSASPAGDDEAPGIHIEDISDNLADE